MDLGSLFEIKTAIEKYNIHYRLKSKDVVFDCGSCFGIYSFNVLTQNNDVFVYAFEPNKKNYDILCENIKNNKVSNIIPINKGLFNKTGELYFKEDGLSSHIDNKGNVKIKIITISDFLTENKIKKVDFIKMDVEGAEIEIMTDYFKSNIIKSHFAIASYHIVNGEKTYVKLEKMFLEHGYKVITENSHLTTYTL